MAEETVQSAKVEEAFENVEKKRKSKDKKAKKKKKKIIIWSILGGVAGVIILLIIVSSIIKKNMPLAVTTTNPTRGDLTATLTVSGNVQTEQMDYYYAPMNLKIGKVVASAGQTVKKGDVIMTFEESSFNDALRTAEINKEVEENSYQSNLKTYNDTKADLATANANISKYQALFDAQEKKIEDQETAISDDQFKKSADLSAKIYKASRDIAEYEYVLANAVDFKISKESIETYKKYVQTTNMEMMEWKRQLDLLGNTVNDNEVAKALTQEKKLLADYEKELTTAKADKEKAEATLPDEYAAENITLTGELSTMQANSSYEDMLALKDGVVAPADGIVTKIGGLEGETMVGGTIMVAVAQQNSFKIDYALSKNELKTAQVGQKAEITIAGNTYSGTVTKISKMATIGENGAASVDAEVHIDNPDDMIYLGLDAKMVITTAQKQNIVMLPVEVVNADKTGEFVYCVENGMVAKKYVTVGISSDEFIEIVEGLTEEDVVIDGIVSELKEGLPVTAIPSGILPATTEETEE